MIVRHATLHDVIGRAARSDGFTFVPAVLDLDGNSFSSPFSLSDLSSERIPPVLRVPIRQEFDAAWIRARLPCVFGFTPPPAETEKALLDVAFVAVPDGSDEGVPIVCSDYYGHSSIYFAAVESDRPLKERVANAFWSVLLSEPEQLADFQTSVYHSGFGGWLDFGCEAGEPYCDERTA